MSHVFVFGSNERGVHGAGAAAYAVRNYNAKMGCGVGLTGSAYAIPTKDVNIETLPLSTIKLYVNVFIDFATRHPTTEFHLTKIGCGLAGYSEREIAPLFENAPDNVSLVDDNGKFQCRASVWNTYIKI